LNIPLRKKRPDVSFETGRLAHCVSLLRRLNAKDCRYG
jgi:hypothetical protein